MQTINLADFQIPRAAVPLGKGQQIMVRGLSADDLSFLVQLHVSEITKALKLYQESRADILVKGNLTQFIMTLSRDFPGLVAEVISLAADQLTDEARAVARQLPIPTQLLALNEITRLTMEEGGGLKNLLAEMRERLQSAAASVGEKS